jgi:hypothetical protein
LFGAGNANGKIFGCAAARWRNRAGDGVRNTFSHKMSQERNAASEVGGTFDKTQMSIETLSWLVATPKLSTRDPLCAHFDRTQQYNKK